MASIVLNVEMRDRVGTGGSRAVRRQGKVPGVLYGGTREPVAVSVDFNELRKAIGRGGLRSHVVQLDHKGEIQRVLVRDIQFDPVSDLPVHLDLFRVEEGQVVSLEIPVRFVNEAASPGLKRGGALNIVRHTVELDCPADAIPELIEIDLTGLEIGDSVHISSVKLPAGVTPAIKGRNFTIATIAGAIAQEAEEAAPAAPVETEVIKKGKAEEAAAEGEKKS